MAKIYAVVRKIPRGSVATYGEVAALAGIESGHRVAARAMRVCPESLPWQRVLGKKDARRGQISIGDAEHAALQRSLLEAEGVVFDDNGCVRLREHGWLW
jgi:methylated-DNA-protein-cysteine methyltransferase-like protein